MYIPVIIIKMYSTQSLDYKVYGCHLPGDEKEHLFAPRNTSTMVYKGKDNLHGIDYSGMTQECFSSEQYNKGIYGMSGQVIMLLLLFIIIIITLVIIRHLVLVHLRKKMMIYILKRAYPHIISL